MAGILKVVTPERLEQGKKTPRELLPPDRLKDIPLIFGAHGTISESASSLAAKGVELSAFMEVQKRMKGCDERGLYMYLSSGQGFDFSPGWQGRVKYGVLRERILLAIKSAFDYSLYKANSWRTDYPGEPLKTMGVSFFRVEDRRLLEDDPDSERADSLGPHSVYLPLGRFGAPGVACIGSVVLDPGLASELQSLDPDFIRVSAELERLEIKIANRARGETESDIREQFFEDCSAGYRRLHLFMEKVRASFLEDGLAIITSKQN